MWVMTTWVSRSGSTAAIRSFWTGLPPQSTRIAPSGATTTSEVVSRASDGTAPEVPRNARCTSSHTFLGDPAALQQQRDAEGSQGERHHADELRDAERPEHQRIDPDRLDAKAPERVETEVGQEQRSRG